MSSVNSGGIFTISFSAMNLPNRGNSDSISLFISFMMMQSFLLKAFVLSYTERVLYGILENSCLVYLVDKIYQPNKLVSKASSMNLFFKSDVVSMRKI